jgi:hypothetical protein
MKDKKPETPPLSRAQRKIADAALAAAKFKPTSDGKSAMRQFEVHGMAVTELVSVTDEGPTGRTTERPAAPISTGSSIQAKEAGPQTPPLSRAERKVADATLAAAQFVPSLDGKNAMRKFDTLLRAAPEQRDYSMMAE